MKNLIERIKKLNSRQLTSVCCLKIKHQIYPEQKKYLSSRNIENLNKHEKRLNDDWEILNK